MKNHATLPSANTSPARAKSLIIRKCENKHCNAQFEITEAFQSHRLCQYCRKPAVCVHKIKTTERCTECFAKHRSWFMRTM
jgi:hypothetical protein